MRICYVITIGLKNYREDENKLIYNQSFFSRERDPIIQSNEEKWITLGTIRANPIDELELRAMKIGAFVTILKSFRFFPIELYEIFKWERIEL